MKRVAIVTGATAGLGKAAVLRLVRDGLQVVAIGRRQERLEPLAQALEGQVFPLALDVTDQDVATQLWKALPADWSDIDVLVNNAGLALGQSPAFESKIADWEQVISTNVLGLIRLTHAILPGMVARNRGHIVNVGSVAANYAYPGGHVYAASKAFVQHFTLNLKADLIGKRVHVTTLAPGLVGGTEFSDVRFAGDKQRAAAIYRDLDHLTADDMADAISWIISRPPHVNINMLEIMPTCQAPGPLVFSRDQS